MGTNEVDATEGLGDRISRLRRAKGWNQRELADRIGARPAQISKYERGIYLPRPELLPRLGDALEVNLDYLMTGRRGGGVRRDLRLREQVEALEALPDTQRANLVAFLDSLLAAHQLLLSYEELLQRQARTAANTSDAADAADTADTADTAAAATPSSPLRKPPTRRRAGSSRT